MKEVKQIGNMEHGKAWDNPQIGRVYLPDGLSPTLNTCSGGQREVKILEPVYGIYTGVSDEFQRGPLKDISRCLKANTHDASVILQEPIIVASRGRNPQNPSDRTTGNHAEQRLEPDSDGICNTLTSVQKDNLVLEPHYRIRKLTPLECWRLMGFTDEDFYKAEKVNSNTQLYKQAGNSIVCPVLENIFRQLF